MKELTRKQLQEKILKLEGDIVSLQNSVLHHSKRGDTALAAWEGMSHIVSRLSNSLKPDLVFVAQETVGRGKYTLALALRELCRNVDDIIKAAQQEMEKKK